MSMILAGPMMSAQEVVIPTDYVSYWSMDNISGSTLIDETGYADGVITNASAVAGHIGNALDFTGSGSHVDVGNKFSFVTNTRNFAFSFWLYIDDLNDSGIFGNTTSSSEKGFYASWNSSGEFFFRMSRGQPGTYLISITNIPAGLTAGSYYHIVINGDNSSGVEILVNNESIHTQGYAAAASTGTHTRSVYLGGVNSVADGNQKLDEFRIYDRPLTTPEINALYNEV